MVYVRYINGSGPYAYRSVRIGKKVIGQYVGPWKEDYNAMGPKPRPRMSAQELQRHMMQIETRRKMEEPAIIPDTGRYNYKNHQIKQEEKQGKKTFDVYSPLKTDKPIASGFKSKHAAEMFIEKGGFPGSKNVFTAPENIVSSYHKVLIQNIKLGKKPSESEYRALHEGKQISPSFNKVEDVKNFLDTLQEPFMKGKIQQGIQTGHKNVPYILTNKGSAFVPLLGKEFFPPEDAIKAIEELGEKNRKLITSKEVREIEVPKVLAEPYKPVKAEIEAEDKAKIPVSKQTQKILDSINKAKIVTPRVSTSLAPLRTKPHRTAEPFSKIAKEEWDKIWVRSKYDKEENFTDPWAELFHKQANVYRQMEKNIRRTANPPSPIDELKGALKKSYKEGVLTYNLSRPLDFRGKGVDVGSSMKRVKVLSTTPAPSPSESEEILSDEDVEI